MREIAFSNNSVNDICNNARHTDLTREEEIIAIKTLKLYYYYEVSEEERQEYLEYYFEVKPEFKRQYLEASEEERKQLLAKEIKKAKKCRDDFLKNNIRFVRYLIPRSTNNTISTEDLLQEGIIGMTEALKTFDLKYNDRFITHAAWKIRQRINAYIQKNSTAVKISAGFNELQMRIRKKTEELTTTLQKEPTAGQIADALGIDEAQVLMVQRIINNELFPLSISTAPKEVDDDKIETQIKDPNGDFTDEIIDASFRQSFKKAFIDSSLTPKSKLVLLLRYGITFENINLSEILGQMIGLNEKSLAKINEMAGKPQTLEEIGKILEVSKERVRQIEVKALQALRTSGKIRGAFDGDKPTRKIVTAPQLVPLTKERKLEIITEEMGKIDEFKRHIIYMLYVRNLSVYDISMTYGINEHEINTIETSFIFRLKTRFYEERRKKVSKQLTK